MLRSEPLLRWRCAYAGAFHDPHADQNGAPPTQRGPGEKGHSCAEKQEDSHRDYSGVRFLLASN